MFNNVRQYPLPLELPYLLESPAAFNPSSDAGPNPVLRAELRATLAARGVGLHRFPLCPRPVRHRDAGRRYEGLTL
jgi:hypothetical protein